MHADPIEQFRQEVLAGLRRLRAVAGTNPDVEYARMEGYILGLPAGDGLPVAAVGVGCSCNAAPCPHSLQAAAAARLDPRRIG